MRSTVLSRRRVMALFSWTGTSVLLGCGQGPQDDSESDSEGPADDRSVVVLGGGLAGLTAAYELQQLGYEVTVLEGQTRLGGRVWTLRGEFSEDQHLEIGAVRIPSTHTHVLDYAATFGLELGELPSGEPLYYLGGERFKHSEGEPWPVADLLPDEATASLGSLWERYIYNALPEFGDPRDGSFPAPGVAEQYDPLTMTEYLPTRGASAAYVKLFAADNGSEVYRVGALPWMALEAADQDWDQTYYIRGGNDKLVDALAAAIGAEKILLDHRVTEIVQSDTSVTIKAVHAGDTVEFTAARVVCTLPFSVLRNIPVDPALPTDKTEVIRDLVMMNAARGYIQTSRQFWADEGIGGLKIALTDTPVERIWDVSATQPNPSSKGLILSYTQSANADAFCGTSQSDRETYTLDHMAAFFPEIHAETEKFFHYCWAEDPWALGAWTAVLPGQWWFTEVAARAEGRIHFAGEHTSLWAGWMHGAIESGKRAVTEIAAS